MALQFSFDVIDGWRVRRTTENTEITRPCRVRGLTVLPTTLGGTDPDTLLRITEDPACPAAGTNFPSAIPKYQACTLQDYEIRMVDRATRTAILNLIYRSRSVKDQGGGGASAWSIEDSTQISHVETYVCSTGKPNITVWYKAGTASGVATPPAGATPVGVAAPKMRPYRVITATALLTGADWAAIRPAINAVAGYINADTWGIDPRGMWFFPGPHTRTNDFGKSFAVSLSFLQDPLLHYPMLFYKDRLGNHPEDSIPEWYLRSGSPPAVGAQIQRSGITWASEYLETNFSSLFAFAP